MPELGDVLVANPSATIEHVISIVPGAPHISCPTHDAGVARGRELAAELAVDVWFTEDHTHFLKIGSYRSAGGATTNGVTPDQERAAGTGRPNRA